MLKQKILAYLANQTAFFDPKNVSDIFTATHIANEFGIKRNTASLYLNTLVNNQQVIKINSRPVYFLHKEAFENQFFPISEYQYPSINDLFTEKPYHDNEETFFNMLIGYNQSLKRPIEQLKMAMLYPNGGLPLLITGASGTGKSYLAKILYQYCINQKIIAQDAPFITFNCAQYTSNPELLTSNLFGYIKGAFTGADNSHPGVFDHANGGILFLDEIHRLNAEGQEKLFTYLDQGIIYRIGDTKNSINLKVRLIFATTENIHETFIQTFLRRIPVRVELPELEHRTKQEKEQLIYFLFQTEAKIINKTLQISPQTLACLKNQTFTGNIGELENVIKNTVAGAFAKQSNNNLIHISIYDIPAQFINQQLLKTVQLNESAIEINKSTNLSYLIHSHNPIYEKIYDTYIKLFALFKGERQSTEEEKNTAMKMHAEINNLFDRLIFDAKNIQNQQIITFIINNVKNELQYLEETFNIQFNGNYAYAISYYLFYRVDFVYNFDLKTQEIIDSFILNISQKNPLVYRLVDIFLQSIDHKIDIQHQPIDIIILTLYLSKTGIIDNNIYTKAIILAHGYATASSIANVANRLLERNLFEAFDMPIDITPNEIANKVMNYIERNDISHGLIILVDMGSLKEIYQLFPHTITSPIAIINNVSTQIALNVGSLILANTYLEKIIEEVTPQNITEHKIIYPERNKPKVIITTCATGIGTANKIKTLLEESIPSSLELNIIAYDFEPLERNKKNVAIFSLYNVIAIIGTLNPNIMHVPYISLEELISGKSNQNLLSLFNTIADDKMIQSINDSIIKNFSLKRVIESVTILDTNKVINHIEQCINQYEQITQSRLANDKKVALYIHISCLIERLIRNMPIETHIHQHDFQCQKEWLEQIETAFSVIESIYSVKIPPIELFYIYDILYQQTDFVSLAQDF